jgi:hypothetical protein
MAETARVAEIALCAAWHSGDIPSPLQTVDGVPVEIVHRGTWSHGLGPDFRDALILSAGRELRAGSIEMHLRTRGWIEHGHHLDEAYDSVVLHVVGRHDATETRRADGAIVPVVEVGPVARFAVPELASWDWARVGGHSCAERVASSRPQALKDALARLGDARLAARSARIEGRLPSEPAGEILWGELLDGLGFAANREPMQALARTLSLTDLETTLQTTPPGARLAVVQGILLGAAGFLPLSPTEAHLGRLDPESISDLEDAWLTRGGAWHADALQPAAWNRTRVRPANHPVPRLLAAANLLSMASANGGLLVALMGILTERDDAVWAFRALCGSGKMGIGKDRAVDMLASGVIPVALALAAQTGDDRLTEAAARHWERLPSPAANAITRRAMSQVAGAANLAGIGARGAQGLIHLDTALCQPRRCFECPIAAAELSLHE